MQEHHYLGSLPKIGETLWFIALWHIPNIGSRVLSLCQKRLPDDWRIKFGHPVLLMETFVDSQCFTGVLYKAANWVYAGETKGFRRTYQDYTSKPLS